MTSEALPTLLVPGLMCSPRLYAEQMAALWQRGSVIVADHRQDDTMAALARRILATAPPRFALAGLSMGGYIALAMMREAPDRIARLALLDTSARPDTPAQTEQRLSRLALADSGRFDEIPDLSFPLSVHASRREDGALHDIVRRMALETGPVAFGRQQRAIMGRPDSRPSLSAIRCPTLVLVGDGDAVTPPDHAVEMAQAIPAAHLTIVPECGHLSTLERPQAVAAALAAWLDA